MIHKNVYGIRSKSIRDALTHDDYDLTDRPMNVFSTTEIIDSPKSRVLSRRHDSEIIVDISDNFHLMDGSAVHYALERSNKNSEAQRLSEERIFIEVGIDDKPWRVFTVNPGEKIIAQPWYREHVLYVSCKFDNYEIDDMVVEDYKRCSVWETIYGLKDSRIQQLNIAAIGLNMLGFPVEKIRACLLLKDWSAVSLRQDEQKGGDTYPKIPYKEYDFPVWPADQTKAYIFERAFIHSNAHRMGDDEIPECNEEERWYRGEAFAVMKTGVKTAKKVFRVEAGSMTKEDAKKYAEDHARELQSVAKKGETFFVEERPGQDIRCGGDKSYCSARTFCHYWVSKYGNKNNSEY